MNIVFPKKCFSYRVPSEFSDEARFIDDRFSPHKYVLELVPNSSGTWGYHLCFEETCRHRLWHGIWVKILKSQLSAIFRIIGETYAKYGQKHKKYGQKRNYLPIMNFSDNYRLSVSIIAIFRFWCQLSQLSTFCFNYRIIDFL